MKLDAVVVGAGPNGLAAAITLASQGLRVRVLEAAERAGGGLATEALTLPGYVHDVCSAVHPLGIGSPLFAALPLDRHGLEWVQPDAPLAHPLDGEPAVLMERSLRATARGLGRDESAYRTFFGALTEDWTEAIPELLAPIGPRVGIARAARYAWRALGSASAVGDSIFQGPRARALFAGIAAHSILPLERPPSAAVALTLGAAGHAVGWPIPRGGADRLAHALVGVLEQLGGEVVCGVRVRSMLEVPPARATLFDLGPRPALAVLGEPLPRGFRRRLERFRYGPGAFKIDWALSEPIPWKDPACRRAGTLHLGGTAPEIAASEAAAWGEHAAAAPFVLLAQPSMFDDTRAPSGRHTAWGYCHVPAGSDRDMTAQIEGQIERFAPGFRDCVLARSVLSPAEFERRNPNLVGGDVGAGVLSLRRVFGRATGGGDPYGTPLPGVFFCSAATPPGAGVHGMCGFHAARSALRQRFGVEISRDPRRVFAAGLSSDAFTPLRRREPSLIVSR